MSALINSFSGYRLMAIIIKEFIQLRRDRLTFAMLIGIPLLQLILFGYAIDMNPRHLPIVLLSADQSNFTRSLIQGMKNTDYFSFIPGPDDEKTAEDWLATTRTQFILHIPQNFTQRLIRGEHPQILLEADGTDPSASGNAVSAMQTLMQTIFNRDLKSLSYLKPTALPATLNIQLKYNPEEITQYNIVPGLLGVVVTMTMVMITTLAITRERERGTMEMLLATPAQPLEVMIGKILPYVMLGYVQVLIILLMAGLLFHVPMHGNLLLLILAMLPFLLANLAIGLFFSTIAKNQLQALQMSFFFFLPSILLSGFMFPFRGMPEWAQWLGSMLPLTHFLIIVRGILLKGNGWHAIYPQIWPIMLFTLAVIALGFKRYKRTIA